MPLSVTLLLSLHPANCLLQSNPFTNSMWTGVTIRAERILGQRPSHHERWQKDGKKLLWIGAAFPNHCTNKPFQTLINQIWKLRCTLISRERAWQGYVGGDAVAPVLLLFSLVCTRFLINLRNSARVPLMQTAARSAMDCELASLLYDGAMLLVCSYSQWRHSFSILSS